MDDKTPKKQPMWLGRPIFDESHTTDLERKAAMYEFAHGLPRGDAESAAHSWYRNQHHIEAAAHHLRGMKMSRASGSFDSSKQHASLYDLHLRQLGHSAMGSVPPEIREAEARLSMGEPSKFVEHPADQYLVHEEPQLAKSEEPLEKASKNVKANRASIYDDKGRERMDNFVYQRLGFRREEQHDHNADKFGDRFAVGPDQRGIVVREHGIGTPEHEAAHALMTPEGSSLRQYQDALGQVGGYDGTLPDRQAEEFGTLKMEAKLARRAGVNPGEPFWIMHKMQAKQDPAKTADAHARADKHISAFEEGRKTIDPKGNMTGPQTIHGKINARALGKNDLAWTPGVGVKKLDKGVHGMSDHREAIHSDRDEIPGAGKDTSKLG